MPTIGNAPAGENTAPNGTEKIPVSGSKYITTLRLLRNPSAWTGNFYAQDAAPSSPVSDDLWWETDTGILWTYGTYAAASRWVSLNVLTGGISSSGAATRSTATISVSPSQSFGSGYDIYLDKLYLRAHVLTTNDANNYWSYALRKVTTSTVPSAGAGTLVGTVTTSAQSAGAWFDVSTTLDAALDGTGAGIEFPFIDITKAGSGAAPGNTWDSIGVSFRLIHP